jgi:nitrite reductase/ring-hydroxylating ferredoxin subunit
VSEQQQTNAQQQPNPQQPSVAVTDVPRGRVARAGKWTVANRDGEYKAVSSRCRHQLADLSKGSVDKNGCLVCPWHGARYDLDSGRMVEGPKGLLNYVGPTPGYTQMIRATIGKLAPLRRRRTRVENERVVVED